MKKVRNILWGVVLIAIGAIAGLNALGITQLDLLFDGWWTLFILVPCTIGLFTEPDKTGSLAGIAIGVFLLLVCQDVLEFSLLWKLLIPLLLVLIGIRLIFHDLFNRKAQQVARKWSERGTEQKEYAAVFSGQDLDFTGEVFEGAELTAVFGGVKCDLTRAVIAEDVVITVTSVFGGVDLLLPEHVNVKTVSTGIFGGISDKRAVKKTDGAVTVYVNATSIFGGTDIK